jgi:putative transposase
MSTRARQDRGLLEEMRAIVERSGGTYGSPLRRRRPDAGLIFHTDRGSEFQGTPVRSRLAASRVRQSMTRGGAPGENAHMESFFHSLKADVIHGRSFQSIAALRQQLRRYVQDCNYRRLHWSLGYQSPVDYERRAA